MVIKVLSGGNGGNLNNADDLFGVNADIISILAGDGPNEYFIFTMANNDIITLTNASSSSFFEVIAGSGNDTVTGGAENDTVYDGLGNDKFNLGGGLDFVRAGGGNDTYNGGTGLDTVSFVFRNASNTAASTTANTTNMTVYLNKTTAQNLGTYYGTDIILGFENLLGGSGHDKLYGSSAANDINGGSGADYIKGLSGNDSLKGRDGKDTLIGGLGKDEIALSESTAARDLAKYLSVNDSKVSSSPTTIQTFDKITNFDNGILATDDRIDLSYLDGNLKIAGNQAFTYRGYASSFTSSAGEVRLQKILFEGYQSTLIHIDTDGDRADEMQILVFNNVGLAKVDFIL